MPITGGLTKSTSSNRLCKYTVQWHPELKSQVLFFCLFFFFSLSLLFIYFTPCSPCQRREPSYSFCRESQKAVRLVRLRCPPWGREGQQQAAVVCVEQHHRAEQKVALEGLFWEAWRGWRGTEGCKRALCWDLSKLHIAASLAVKLLTFPFHLMVKCERRWDQVQSLRIVCSFSSLGFLPQVAQGRVSYTHVGSCSTDRSPSTWAGCGSAGEGERWEAASCGNCHRGQRDSKGQRLDCFHQTFKILLITERRENVRTVSSGVENHR